MDDDTLRKFLFAWPEKAIEYLYRHYFSELVRNAMHRVTDLGAAEDIAQESLADLWENHEHICSKVASPVVQYLFTIVKNKSIDYVHKRDSPSQNFLFYVADLPELPLADTNDVRKEGQLSATLWNILATFPRRERQCLVMKHYRRMSLEEIATEMDVTRKAVERSMTCAYKRLEAYRLRFL